MPSVIDSLKVNIMGKVHILCAKMPRAQHTHTHTFGSETPCNQ